MPNRQTRSARRRAAAPRFPDARAATAPTTLAASLTRAASGRGAVGFVQGDAVFDRNDPGRIGRVCEVTTPGLSYLVRFADSAGCLPATQSSIGRAPAGTLAPDCPQGC